MLRATRAWAVNRIKLSWGTTGCKTAQNAPSHCPSVYILPNFILSVGLALPDFPGLSKKSTFKMADSQRIVRVKTRTKAFFFEEILINIPSENLPKLSKGRMQYFSCPEAKLKEPTLNRKCKQLFNEQVVMGAGAAGGLWRHQQWPPSWILQRIKNQVKTARNGNFLCLISKTTHK